MTRLTSRLCAALLVLLTLGGCATFGEDGDVLAEQLVMRLMENASDPQETAEEILLFTDIVEGAISLEAGTALYGEVARLLERELEDRGWRRSDIRLAQRVIERNLPVADTYVVDLVPLNDATRAEIRASLDLIRETVEDMRE